MTEETDEGRQFPNPFLAASMLPPGRRRLEAVQQFLEEEQHRLHKRLIDLENDDGSIPDDVTDEWSMVKGKLDQTRLFHGLAVKGILTHEMMPGEDGECPNCGSDALEPTGAGDRCQDCGWHHHG